MFGKLLQFIILIFGKKLNVNPLYSTPTKTIILLFGKTRQPWLWGSLFHGYLAIIVFGAYVLLEKSNIHLPTIDLWFIILALSWAFIGPPFLWHYEVNLIRKLKNKLTPLMSADVLKQGLPILDARITGGFFAKSLLITWIIACFIYCLKADDFFFQLGLTKAVGFWNIPIYVGTCVYAYYTGLGFLSVVKAVKIINFICKSDINLKIYNHDKNGGLAFVGKFAVFTSLMFSTGAFFIPILYTISIYNTKIYTYYFVLYVVIYLIFALFPFLYLIYKLRKKLKSNKYDLSKPFLSLLEDNKQKYGLQKAVELESYAHLKNALSDISEINDWPIDVNTSVKAVFTTLIPPITLYIRYWIS